MKYNKGFAPLILLAIIVGALVVGGGAVYFATKTPTSPKNIGENNYQPQENQNQNGVSNITVQNNEEVKNQNNIPTEKTSVKTYKNINAEYSVNYPTNWQLWPTNNSDTNFFSSFGIKNNNLSSISISVSFGLPFDQNKDYSKYSTIDEYINDYKVSGTPKESVQGYLNKVSSINIGGKLLRVQSEKAVDGPNGSVNDSYLFIYNGKSYAIGFDSINRAQYNIDHKVFVDFLNSFVLN